MRQILEELDRRSDWVPVVELAADLAASEFRVSRSSEESVKRACHRLAVQGYVEIAYQFYRRADAAIRFEFYRKGRQRTWLVVRRKRQR